MKQFDFTGRRVLITGGTNGMGNAMARAFRELGAAVTVTGTKPREAYDTDLHGLDVRQFDAGDPDQVDRLIGSIDALDVLINNGAMVLYRGQEFEMEGFRRVMEVNINAVMQLCTGFRPKLAKRRGAIVNVASLAAFGAVRGNPAYGASKAAVVNLTKTLAVAFAKDQIRVNGLAPGYVKTNITEVSHTNEQISDAIVQKTPMRRWGEPEDMVGPVLFLASNDIAGFVTGQTLAADGGYSLQI
ncbi:MAG: SDR family NAD(P)-dependent oxidoreductase [Minwuia sp.]|uniref:SDR family NAD(P)-dependent oxidoreductase n=1 Tax=Minwuia sp. TaxID=2493630 RepID=UPI003A83B99A